MEHGKLANSGLSAMVAGFTKNEGNSGNLRRNGGMMLSIKVDLDTETNSFMLTQGTDRVELDLEQYKELAELLKKAKFVK